MNVGNVIFALFLVVGGFSTAAALFVIELITAKVGFGTGLMNFYNHRVESEKMLGKELGDEKRWGKAGRAFKNGKKKRVKNQSPEDGHSYLPNQYLN